MNIASTRMIPPMAKNTSEETGYCPSSASKKKEDLASAKNEDLVNWSHQELENVLSAFYLGYFVMHIPTGFLIDKFGARHVLGTSICISLIITVSTPITILFLGYWPVFFLRVCLGLAQASLYPAATSLLRYWVPITERSTMSSFVYSGSTVGTLLCNVFSGWFLTVTSWKNVFYIWSAIACFGSIFYYCRVFSTPNNSPFITDKELRYITDNQEVKLNYPIPWKALAKDPVVYIIFISHFAHDWLFYTLQVNLPIFLDKVLHMQILTNGILSAAPFIAMFSSSVISGVVSDVIFRKKLLRVVTVRKINTTIGTMPPAALLVMTCYVGCSPTAVNALFCASLLFKGVWYAGTKTNVIDVTKHFSGTLMAIVNGFGSLAGVAGMYSVGWIVKHHTFNEWRLVFWITLAISLIANICFILFATDKRRPWDYVEGEEREEQVAPKKE